MAIMGGLSTGLERAVPGVRRTLQGVTTDIPSFAAPPGVAATARQSSDKEIVIRSDGSRLGDLLVETLRRSIKDKGGDVQKVLGK
jgi:hypothetical protein